VLEAASSTASLNIGLLERLRAAGGEFVPWAELGPVPERVHGDLDALAGFGFGIERHPNRGAAYGGPAERLCPDQIEHELGARWIGRRIAVWSRVTSTNDLAARAGRSTANAGLVVLAEEQTAGRGRRGRSWRVPPRSSILMSVVLFPPEHLTPGLPEAAFGSAWLTALGAVATAEVVSEWSGREATIKWPNDVRVGGRKIAGILVERALAPRPRDSSCPAEPAGPFGRGAVIGIGLNVNVSPSAFPPDLSGSATSLQIERGGAPVDRSELVRHLIHRLDFWYDTSQSGGGEVLNTPWRARSEHLGRIVQVATPTGRSVGRLVDIDVRFGLTLAHESPADPDAQSGCTPRLRRVPLAEILAIDATLDQGPSTRVD
jgi:BirA family biotin operon repressor/biotin-[acetyl-CoA-carboxylase] ligase